MIPEFFGSLPIFIACFLIMAGAQMIYATVGFGAGMFAVALMALILPDLAGVVVVLLVLTFITEVWVLARTWRHVRIRLLGWLMPGMIVGLWLGTQILVTTDVSILKQFLGYVVFGAGLYFVLDERNCQRKRDGANHETTSRIRTRWVLLPTGLASGVLGGLFGTGGPPVIIFLRAHRLEKAVFRSTILTYFMSMSLLRAGTYTNAELITLDYVMAAAWLLPGSVAGMLVGMFIHDRISERQFSHIVAVLLMLLGVPLAIGVGR